MIRDYELILIILIILQAMIRDYEEEARYVHAMNRAENTGVLRSQVDCRPYSFMGRFDLIPS